MTISSRRAAPHLVLISGMDQDLAPYTIWRQAMFQMAVNLQSMIANTFAAQRTALGHLKPNDPRYTARKVRQGFDHRKGHRTNTLQSFMRPDVMQLFVIIGPSRTGKGQIIFQESRLTGLMPHFQYYAEAKARGGRLLVVAASWLKAASAPLFAVDAQARLAARAALAGRPAPIRAALGLTGRFSTSLARQATAGLSRSQAARLARLIGRA